MPPSEKPGESPLATNPPHFIGAYRIERSLGRGGMGEVVLAWDERLERHVAIKRIRGDKPIDPRNRARFRREARAIARLSHPVIVQIFDLVETPDGECIVMEYVDGKSLDQVLAGPPLPLGLVLKLGTEIADGLGQAHGKGLVHRDLKPQNVIVTPSEHAKILDFGLTRMLGREAQGADPEADEGLTQPGTLVGTASAMSPEQARGNPIDHRSDLFALGSLLYQMVTGRPPFSGSNLLETLYKVTSHKPPPVAELRSGVPAQLSTLIDALLAKEPDARPQSARLVMAELEQIARTVEEQPWSGPAVAAAPAVQGELANMSTAAPLPVRAVQALASVSAARPENQLAPPVPVVRVLVITELLTRAPAGDASSPWGLTAANDDRLLPAARDALARFGGLEAEGTGHRLVWIFERPTDAIGFALAYHHVVAALTPGQEGELAARATVHQGEIALRESEPRQGAQDGRQLAVSGLPRLACERILTLALPHQTLLTRGVFDLARQPAARGPLADSAVRWLAHGPYSVQGVAQPMELFEVGAHGAAPLAAPPDSEHGKRIVGSNDEATLGWRPAAGQAIPQRPNWTLRERLGQGGFGEIWLATHPSGDSRVFKFCFEAARLRALKREITLVRLLEGALGQRQDIARILDWDVTTAPYFIESEYTEGGDLVDWSDEQGGIAEVPLETRLALVAEVADALAAAHSVGVLHKDVKPQNVLVTRDREGRPHARLADFGVGLVLDQDSLAATEGLRGLGFTGTLANTEAQASGTLGYLAPELIEGKTASIQADIYALGVMLYQLVAGDFSRTLAPGWQRDIQDELLAQDIASMVDRAPERRPASTAEVAEKLRTLKARHAERARAEQARRDADEAARALARAHQRRKAAGWAAALLVVMLSVVSIFAWQAYQSRERERAAREHADLRRAQAEGLIDFMLVDLRGKLEPMGKLAILDEVGKRALEYFAAVPESELSDVELQSRVKALRQLGEVRVALGNLPEATGAFREALRLSESLAARAPEDTERQFELGQSHFWVGYLLWQQKDLAGAMGPFRAYLAVSEALVTWDPRNRKWMLELAYAHSNLGSVAREHGDHASAQASLRASAGIMETLLAQTPEDDALRIDLGHVHAKLGDLLAYLGDLPGATEWFEKYLSAMQSLVERRPDDMKRLRYLGYAHSLLGDVLADRGELDGALAHFQANLKIAERLAAHDADDRSLARQLGQSKNKVAGVHLVRREFEAALVLLDAERAILDELLAHDTSHRDWRFMLAHNHRVRSTLLAGRGQLPKALEYARSAAAVLQELAAAAPEQRDFATWLAQALWQLGRMLERAGSPGEARAAWQQGLELCETLARQEHSPFLLNVRARLLLALDRVEEAKRDLEQLGHMGYREASLVEFLRERGIALMP
ncbi:MAG TPA: protein kinase [Hyalangium sp.]|nr:protein kinase [Hyalangium sp.]